MSFPRAIDFTTPPRSNSIDFVLTDPPYITLYRARAGKSVINDDNDRNGRSLLLISENGGGKSSVLSAVAMTLGRDRLPIQTDFRDLNLTIEITAGFTDFDANEQAAE